MFVRETPRFDTGRRGRLRLSVGAQTALYDFGFAILTIVVAVIVGAVAFPIVGPASAVLGPVAAALVNVAGRYVWPSPKARADRRAVADLRRQIDAFGRPARIIDDARQLQKMQSYGGLRPRDRR